LVDGRIRVDAEGLGDALYCIDFRTILTERPRY